MIIFLNIFIGICIFIIGALFGSFFSLALYRIPRHEDIIIKNSYCPKCKHNLGFFDLIPILSFILRGGKCKYCKEKISIRYLIFEILNGVVFTCFYIIMGYNLKLLIVCIIYIVMFFVVGIIISNYNYNKKRVVENKEKKIENKKGVFLTELIVAIIFFSVVLTSMYVVTRNTVNKSVTSIARANALSLAVKNVEIAKLTEYDMLTSFSDDENVDNIDYHIEVKISKLSDEESDKQDIVKKIEASVTYNVNGKDYEFLLNSVKGKVESYE